MMRKAALLLFCIIILVFPRKVSADTKFDTSAVSLYSIDAEGMTHVSQQFTITNKTQYYFTPTYTVNLGISDAKNITVKEGSGGLSFEKINTSGGMTISITMPQRIVGKGRKTQFVVDFDTQKIARHLGNTWEIKVPGLSNPDSFSEYSVKLNYPSLFGDLSIEKGKGTIKGNSISFTKQELGKAGAVLFFGENQYFKLNLSYHLSNKNLFPIKTEIAIPPQTNYQKVIITSISENPLNVREDTDGNWLAEYSLAPQEQKTIQVEELVNLIPYPAVVSLTADLKKLYTRQEPYWESNSSAIKKIASTLTSPSDIYQYVVKTLKYDYQKTSDESVRLGAIKTLQEPADSVCLEFTDLFVALARAKGIPARGVEGYAYTQNDRQRPLSLVKDVLHAWPEYYDEGRKTWIMIDPTWGNTTSGIDYFSSLDLSHVAFVIKGEDSSYPIPAGGYKFSQNTKDVNVSFLNPEEFVDLKKGKYSLTLSDHALAGIPIKSYVTISNDSGSVVTGKYAEIDSDLFPSKHSIYIDSLLPYEKKTYEIVFNRVPFLTNKSYNVTIHFDGNTYHKKIAVNLIPDMKWVSIGGIFVAACITLSGFAYKTWCLLIHKQKK